MGVSVAIRLYRLVGGWGWGYGDMGMVTGQSLDRTIDRPTPPPSPRVRARTVNGITSTHYTNVVEDLAS